MAILENFAFLMSLLGVVVAQALKVPIHLIFERRLKFGLLLSNGSMPSSHSCAVTSLATGVGLESGFDTPVFAVAAMFAIITMFDAAGVRRQAGEHASLLNQMRRDFAAIKNWQSKGEYEKQKELKELLGHKPAEVYSGAVIGIIMTVLIYQCLWIQ